MGRKPKPLSSDGVIPERLAQRLAVQDPPRGAFDATALTVTLVSGKGLRGSVGAARIHTDRLQDFLEGMGATGSVSKFIRRDVTSKRVEGNGVRVLFECQRAAARVARMRVALPKKPTARGPGQLKGNQTKLKCGCTAKFTATVWGNDTVLYLHDLKHTHPDKVAMPRFMPTWVNEYIRECWLAKQPVEGIVAQIKLRVWAKLSNSGPEEHRRRTQTQWRALWEAKKEAPPRAYLVNAKYVSAIILALDKSEDHLLPDEADSVLAWVESHEEDVCFYQRGVPVKKGTPENVRLHCLHYRVCCCSVSACGA